MFIYIKTYILLLINQIIFISYTELITKEKIRRGLQAQLENELDEKMKITIKRNLQKKSLPEAIKLIITSLDYNKYNKSEELLKLVLKCDNKVKILS